MLFYSQNITYYYLLLPKTLQALLNILCLVERLIFFSLFMDFLTRSQTFYYFNSFKNKITELL